MRRLVWDTSAVVNIKEPNEDGYSPGLSLWKDLSDSWIEGPYKNLIPAISAFEVSHAISRKHEKGIMTLREFWIMGENETLYPVDQEFIGRASTFFDREGFKRLRGPILSLRASRQSRMRGSSRSTTTLTQYLIRSQSSTSTTAEIRRTIGSGSAYDSFEFHVRREEHFHRHRQHLQ